MTEGRSATDPRRLIDAGVAGVVGVLAVADVAASSGNETWQRPADALAYLLVIIGALSLYWRRRAPVVVLATVTAVIVAMYLREYGAYLSVLGLPALYAVAAHEELPADLARRRALDAHHLAERGAPALAHAALGLGEDVQRSRGAHPVQSSKRRTGPDLAPLAVAAAQSATAAAVGPSTGSSASASSSSCADCRRSSRFLASSRLSSASQGAGVSGR